MGLAIGLLVFAAIRPAGLIYSHVYWRPSNPQQLDSWPSAITGRNGQNGRSGQRTAGEIRHLAQDDRLSALVSNVPVVDCLGSGRPKAGAKPPANGRRFAYGLQFVMSSANHIYLRRPSKPLATAAPPSNRLGCRRTVRAVINGDLRTRRVTETPGRLACGSASGRLPAFARAVRPRVAEGWRSPDLTPSNRSGLKP
jgi:hypothetical protein